MPKMLFAGLIYPRKLKLTLPLQVPIDWKIEAINMEFKCLPNIINGEFTAECELNRTPNADEVSLVFGRAYSIVRVLIDMYSFFTGNAVTMVFDRLVSADGEQHEWFAGDVELRPICTAYDKQPLTWFPVLREMISTPELQHAMADLTDCIGIPHLTVINCARAIEAIRNLIAEELIPSGADRIVWFKNHERQAWNHFGSLLRIEQSYTQPIISSSRGPRHGRRWTGHQLPTNQITRRGWTIMNRFLEYRKRGSTQLPLADFPILA
jgi:hypothetical protein